MGVDPPPSLGSLQPLPAPPALPALAGKELTSRLLSVNVELLIPTAKRSAGAAAGVGGSRQPREQALQPEPEPEPGLRGPELSLGDSSGHGASFTCSSPAFEPEVLILSPRGHRCPPPQEGRTNFLGEATPAARALLAGRGAADVWTDR